MGGSKFGRWVAGGRKSEVEGSMTTVRATNSTRASRLELAVLSPCICTCTTVAVGDEKLAPTQHDPHISILMYSSSDTNPHKPVLM